MKKSDTKSIDTHKRPPLSPLGSFILAGVALGLSYIAGSRAIYTGSLLEYTAAIILFVLGVRHLYKGFTSGKR